ncbi:MAG: FliA/WhiG family RNA polymerase sigma factor [Clostridiaceae bacterium]|nr:FliA/WhiG family RNA polymerase sigma factor [Clostridiaceae bacterium]
MQVAEAEKITEAHWAKYKEGHSRELRNQILMAYMHVVTCNVRKMFPVFKGYAETQDIINQGIIALMECIDKYDIDRGVQFDSYASMRVRGSIIDYVRKQDWVPRGTRKRFTDIGNAYQTLQEQHGRPATDEEVAEHLGMGIEELNKNLSEVYSSTVLSFEELVQESLLEDSNSDLGNPEGELQKTELRQMLAAAIDRLDERERMVVSLYYYDELKLKEIALVMGLTPSRVSQMHTKAILKMKGFLNRYIKG